MPSTSSRRSRAPAPVSRRLTSPTRAAQPRRGLRTGRAHRGDAAPGLPARPAHREPRRRRIRDTPVRPASGRARRRRLRSPRVADRAAGARAATAFDNIERQYGASPIDKVVLLWIRPPTTCCGRSPRRFPIRVKSSSRHAALGRRSPSSSSARREHDRLPGDRRGDTPAPGAARDPVHRSAAPQHAAPSTRSRCATSPWSRSIAIAACLAAGAPCTPESRT